MSGGDGEVVGDKLRSFCVRSLEGLSMADGVVECRNRESLGAIFGMSQHESGGWGSLRV